MSSSSYSSMLRDARWQRKRLEIMERDEFTCRMCGVSDENEGTTLNVHHAFYTKGKKPWEYENDTLFTYCEDCHKDIQHNVYPAVHTSICRMTDPAAHYIQELAESGELEIVIHKMAMDALDAFRVQIKEQVKRGSNDA